MKIRGKKILGKRSLRAFEAAKTPTVRSWEVYSVDIRNISNVLINTTIFFSQLVIVSKTFETNEIKIRNLRTNEAIFARRIIEGLRTFENQKISTSSYTKKDLLLKLQQLSTTEIVL